MNSRHGYGHINTAMWGNAGLLSAGTAVDVENAEGGSDAQGTFLDEGRLILGIRTDICGLSDGANI
jgi:hypothetical protein